jgi:hypothetical protein
VEFVGFIDESVRASDSSTKFKEAVCNRRYKLEIVQTMPSLLGLQEGIYYVHQ